MNKTFKIIIIGIVIILVLAILRNKSYDKIEFSNDLSDVPQPSNLELKRTNTVDFSQCNENDSFSLETNTGSGGLKITNFDEQYCYVETRYEIEGSFFINQCRVPRAAGEIEFTGNNFEAISSYCQIKKEGGGMLDLKPKR